MWCEECNWCSECDGPARNCIHSPDFDGAPDRPSAGGAGPAETYRAAWAQKQELTS